MEVHTDMAAVPSREARRKARLMTVGHLDRRTRASKRARGIATELERSFGADISTVQRQIIGRAAVLCALAEDMATRRLAGQPIPIGDVLRAEGVAKRAVEAVIAACPVKPAAARALERARARWDAQRQPENTKTKVAQAAARREKPSAQRRGRPPGHDPTQADD
jgi:hypothetical protein